MGELIRWHLLAIPIIVALLVVLKLLIVVLHG
jgi:hypothetical protein